MKKKTKLSKQKELINEVIRYHKINERGEVIIPKALLLRLELHMALED